MSERDDRKDPYEHTEACVRRMGEGRICFLTGEKGNLLYSNRREAAFVPVINQQASLAY